MLNNTQPMRPSSSAKVVCLTRTVRLWRADIGKPFAAWDCHSHGVSVDGETTRGGHHQVLTQVLVRQCGGLGQASERKVVDPDPGRRLSGGV